MKTSQEQKIWETFRKTSFFPQQRDMLSVQGLFIYILNISFFSTIFLWCFIHWSSSSCCPCVSVPPLSHSRRRHFTNVFACDWYPRKISESPWVLGQLLSAPCTPDVNSLEQLDFVLKSRSHTNPTHTHTCWHTLFLATSDLSAAGGNIIQSVSRVYQQMSTIWWLPAHQPPVSCWIPHPSLSLSLSLRSLITEKLVPTTSSASTHQLQRCTCDIINLCVKRCVCACV